MPRLLIDGTALSAAAKGVGRYSYHLIDGLTRRLDTKWSITVLFTEGPVPVFTGPNRPACRYIPRVPEMIRSLIIIPSAMALTRSDFLLVPMDGTAISAGRRRITVVHDIADLIDIASLGRRKRGMVASIRRYLYDRSLCTAAAIVCNSEFTAREVILRHRVSPQNVRLGYCGVDERFYLNESLNARDCWPEIGAWKGYVLTFATGDPREAYHLCPQIWKIVHEKMSNIGLVVAGICTGSEYADRLRSEFLRLGLTEGRDFIFLRFLAEAEFEKLRVLYRDADFYLELSRHEGFGMQLAEAMAAGTTCISSGAGALGEIGGGFALMVEAPEAAAFAEAIVDGYRQARHLRDNREQIEHTRRFNWNDVAETVASDLVELQRRATGESR